MQVLIYSEVSSTTHVALSLVVFVHVPSLKLLDVNRIQRVRLTIVLKGHEHLQPLWLHIGVSINVVQDLVLEVVISIKLFDELLLPLLFHLDFALFSVLDKSCVQTCSPIFA